MPRGGAFYDAPGVLERYREARPAGVSDPVLVMEEPALLEALGPVEGLRIVDLGCGEAALGRVLLGAGCARYLGVDGSERMVLAARETLRDTAGEVVRGDIEDFAAPPGAFDLVVSRMALQYVEDIGRVPAAGHACLTPGGRVVLTVAHPSSRRTMPVRARTSCARTGSSTTTSRAGRASGTGTAGRSSGRIPLFLLLAGARR